MPWFEVISYVDKDSIARRLLIKKHFLLKYFFRMFYIYIPALVKKSTGKRAETLVIQI